MCPATCVSIRRHTSAYVSIRQHTSAYVGICQHMSAYISIRQGTERQHTSAHVSIHLHTPAYASIRQHTSAHLDRGDCQEEKKAQKQLIQSLHLQLQLRQHWYFYTSNASKATQTERPPYRPRGFNTGEAAPVCVLFILLYQ